jgi:hypothetical protein
METRSSGLQPRVTLARDIFALARDALLAIFGILLLLFPSRLNAILLTAGVEEGTFAGFKWKSNLVKADAALKESQVQITNLEKQLGIAQARLAEAHPRAR